MSNIVNKTTMQYLKSVNTPDYNETIWWINPTLPNCIQKYWKNDSGSLAEMSQAEKDAVDIAEQEAEDDLEELRKDIDSLERLVKSFALVCLDQFNTLRQQHSLSEITVSQLRNAVKTKYDE